MSEYRQVGTLRRRTNKTGGRYRHYTDSHEEQQFRAAARPAGGTQEAEAQRADGREEGGEEERQVVPAESEVLCNDDARRVFNVRRVLFVISRSTLC